jgi:dimethylamine---corrinoid protein Co-methyltransferase
VGAGDSVGMGATHPLAAGMGGIRTAGDLVARMQMSRGMRLPEAKQYVAGKLGCSLSDLSDPYAMEEIRRDRGMGRIYDHSNLHPNEASAMMAKFHIADALDITIASVDRFKDLAGI